MNIQLKTILGIAFLYTGFTKLISLLSMMPGIFLSNDVPTSLGHFVRYSIWGFLAAGVISVMLYVLSKKQKQGFMDMLRDDTIRSTAGALILIDGVIGFVGSISSVTALFSLLKTITYDVEYDSSISACIVITSVVIIKIVIGILMLKHDPNKQIEATEEPE